MTTSDQHLNYCHLVINT